jgi:ATP-binding cassette, subfamily B, bacterial
VKIPLKSYWDILSSYVGRRKPMFALTAILIFTGIGLQLFNPQIMRRVIDGATSGAETSVLLSAAILFVVIAVVQQAVGVLAVWFGENLAWRATNELRRDLAIHCLSLDMGWHTKTPPGDLIQRIDGDVAELSGFFSQIVIRISGNVFLLLGILAMLYRENALLGAAFTAFSALALTALYTVRNVAVGPEKDLRETQSELAAFIEERLSGTEDIRSGGAVPWVIRGLYRLHHTILRQMKRAWLMGGLVFRAVAGAVFIAGMSLAYAGGYTMSVRGLASIGTVYLIVYYTNTLGRPIRELARQMQSLQNVGASVERIRELRSLSPAVRDGTEARLEARGPVALRFESVRFSYNEAEPVLNDVSFSLDKRRVLGLLGRTGSGKSTIARLLFRFYDPVAGSVRFDGIDARSVPLADLRRSVGMVTQEVQLFQATVRDNLTFFDGSIPDGAILEAVRELGLSPWLERLPEGLSTTLSTGGRGLSAGEAQLLAFTRIFLRDPGLVILDEASSRLDPATEQLIERAVDRLLEDRTAIVIAHRLATVERADDILVLENGAVLEYGKRTALIADPGSRFSQLLARGIEEVLA